MRFLRYLVAAATLLALPVLAQSWTPLDTLNFSSVANGANFTPTAYASPSTGRAWTDVATGKYTVTGGQLVGTPNGTDFSQNFFVSGAAGNQLAQREVVTLSATTQTADTFALLRYSRSTSQTAYLVALHVGGGLQLFSYVNNNHTALNVQGSSDFTYTAGHTYTLDVSATGSSPTLISVVVTDTTTNTVLDNVTASDSTAGLQTAGGMAVDVTGSGSSYISSIVTYQQSSTPPVTATNNLVFFGDSLSAEQTATGAGTVNAPGIQTVLAAFGSTAQASNAGFPGNTMVQLLSDYDSSVSALWQSGMTNYLFVQGCHNTYAQSGATVQDCENGWKALVAHVLADHPWRVVISTEPPAALTQYPANFNTLRSTSNIWLRQNWPALKAFALCDIEGDARIGVTGAQTNGAYFYTDLTHMTNAGYTVWANYMAAAALNPGAKPRTGLTY